MDIRVVPARDEHLQGLLDLLTLGLREQEAFAAACDPPESDWVFDTEFREHRNGLREQLREWRVALDDTGRVVGLLWLQFRSDRLGPYGTVRQIVVDPAFRKRGVGTQLLQHAESEVRDSDAVMFLISALRPNPAWKLYRSLGFTDFPDAFREDTNPEHVVLWKWLNGSDPPRAS